MKLVTVGTGSSGNCHLIQRDNDHWVALDCGCKWSEVLIGCGFRPIDIDLALVTHSHRDHSRYVGDFKKSGIEVYGVNDLRNQKSLPERRYKVCCF